MPKSSRWMGTRYAMVRYAEDSDTIRLRKIRAEYNVADIVTKCLVGAPFIVNRARILGLPHLPTHADATATGVAAAEKLPQPNNSSTRDDATAATTAAAVKLPRNDKPPTQSGTPTSSANAAAKSPPSSKHQAPELHGAGAHGDAQVQPPPGARERTPRRSGSAL